MNDFELEEFVRLLKERLYPKNGSCITGKIANIDESWPEREKEAKELRKLLGLPDSL